MDTEALAGWPTPGWDQGTGCRRCRLRLLL